MNIIILTVIVFVLLFLFLGLKFEKDTRGKTTKIIGWKLRPIQLVSLFSFVLLFFGMFIQVNANEVGIVYDPFNGGIQEDSYSEGFHIKSVFQKITKISTTNRTSRLVVFAQTKDSIYAEFQITLIYKIEGANAGSFYKKTGNNDIKEEQLVSNAIESLQKVSSKNDIYAILGGKLEEVRAEFTEDLKKLMNERYHVTIVSTSFDDVDGGDRIEAIIQNKAEAMQQVEIAELEKQKAEIEADTAVIRAEGEAEVALIKAEAEAEAQIILNSVTVNAINNMYIAQFAEGENSSTPEAYGYLTIQEISKIILTQLYYDTWDGKLPEVITDDSGIIINP